MSKETAERFALPRSTEGLCGLAAQMASALKRLEVAPKLAFKADLVAEEILTNLVKFAAPSSGPDEGLDEGPDEGPDKVTVTLWREGCGLTLVIEDRTVPFSPVWAPEADRPDDITTAQPGGLGLSLVRQTADALNYDSLPEGNRLVAFFRG